MVVAIVATSAELAKLLEIQLPRWIVFGALAVFYWMFYFAVAVLSFMLHDAPSRAHRPSILLHFLLLQLANAGRLHKRIALLFFLKNNFLFCYT